MLVFAIFLQNRGKFFHFVRIFRSEVCLLTNVIREVIKFRLLTLILPALIRNDQFPGALAHSHPSTVFNQVVAHLPRLGGEDRQQIETVRSRRRRKFLTSQRRERRQSIHQTNELIARSGLNFPRPTTIGPALASRLR